MTILTADAVIVAPIYPERSEEDFIEVVTDKYDTSLIETEINMLLSDAFSYEEIEYKPGWPAHLSLLKDLPPSKI